MPTIVWATSRYGSVGAGYVWFALNAGYLLIAIPLMHRRLLLRGKWSWYLNDIGLPFIGTAFVGGTLWWLTSISGSGRFQMGSIMAVGLVLFFVAIISASRLRSEAIEWLMPISKKLKMKGISPSDQKPYLKKGELPFSCLA